MHEASGLSMKSVGVLPTIGSIRVLDPYTVSCCAIFHGVSRGAPILFMGSSGMQRGDVYTLVNVVV